MTQTKRELLANGTALYYTKAYRFGQDAFLLAHFCNPHKNQTIADFGTGCGIITLRWHDRGHRGKCVSIDIQKDAVLLLQKALEENQEASRHIQAYCGDLRSLPPHILPEQSFDLIACNPPYFTAGLVSPQPERATARHQLCCTIEDICSVAGKALKDGAKLCICQRPEQLCAVMSAMRAFKIEPKRLQMVHARLEKAPWLFLLEGQKNRACGLQVLPPLITQNEDFTPSDAILQIYGQQARRESI